MLVVFDTVAWRLTYPILVLKDMYRCFLLAATKVAATYPMSFNSFSLIDSVDSFVIPVFAESLSSGDPWFVRLETWSSANIHLVPGVILSIAGTDQFSDPDLTCGLSPVDIWTGPVETKDDLLNLPNGAMGSLGCGPKSAFAKAFPVFSLGTLASTAFLELKPLDCAPRYHEASLDDWTINSHVNMKLIMDTEGEVWKKVSTPVARVEISNRPVTTLDPLTWDIFSISLLEIVKENWETDGLGRMFSENPTNCDLESVMKFPRISIFPAEDAGIEYEIGSEEYVVKGTPRHATNGCTINVVLGDKVSTGSAFLAKHSIEFDSERNRIGVC